MDMVARVLKKYLKLDQRKFQMNSLLRVYGYETRRSVAEALGLVCLVYYFLSLSSRSWIFCSLLLCLYLNDISNYEVLTCQFHQFLCYAREFYLELCKIDLNKQCGEASVLCSVCTLCYFIFQENLPALIWVSYQK